MKFTNHQRSEAIQALQNGQYDILVIGGGITGAGIAVDASMRGMKTALIDMQDFAAGTSSRSTKLVHGGLRYLKQFEVKMVAEVGKERAIVYENGPHVTTPEWMLLPFHAGGTFGPFSTSLGLRVYDFLAGVKRSERRKMFSASETLKQEPLVKREGLKGGGYYVEYRTDDARLTLEVMKRAAEKGAHCLNYVKAEGFTYEDGKVTGVQAIDQLTGQALTITAAKVINASGPWVDEVRKKDGSENGKHLRLTKGVHIVIDQSVFPLQQAVYFDTPDKRMVFAIPRDGKTYVGTTDTFYNTDPIRPDITAEDRAYLLDAIRFMFPSVKVGEADIESSWSGVRPLIYEEGKDPSEISRKDEIWETESGLLTIAGGKLTGYRKMAETIVDLVAKRLKEDRGILYSPSETKHLPISGGDVGGSANFPAFVQSKTAIGAAKGFTQKDAEKIARMYGSNAEKVFAYKEDSELPDLLNAQLMYAIEEEMAYTPADFFIRRTGALLFDIQTVLAYKEQVINKMARLFGWSEEERAKHATELQKEIDACS
ncbi:FAD-dependent oxidoreductase [Domibacillus sp. DTU_2020_1001157_1_SI_ALB_TIR_016]|uniref:glycerol-3-phosphate dehydrogenase/oxidase n=1 Tax=Domibacillus sp. DTU_2020_1001157_1_SI_ALB_TIR_016 TaxID=3077789 RepID=UPI0028EB1D56|nr:FAD-dependent oxidoreductase [Domibacillus sp. DTU_2020_1001157_1_SI_ALB_TIR_016]WNS79646.1 FAD-dependent oxidoreductase [Domibacillus sp. DTU_2020_1001157_1_SI_ALB_TIR_016]